MTLESPQKIEEGRGLGVELRIKPSDARHRPFGLGELTFCDPTVHRAAATSTTHTKLVLQGRLRVRQ
jgi:hypothetical protein